MNAGFILGFLISQAILSLFGKDLVSIVFRLLRDDEGEEP
jgi:hypothetical protein